MNLKHVNNLELQIKTLERIVSSEITRGLLMTNIEEAKLIRKDINVIKDMIEDKKHTLRMNLMQD
tara:strand:- start:1306 stop:1500 length:195 start_codon:yes stop_codon:yes gene_type:complete